MGSSSDDEHLWLNPVEAQRISILPVADRVARLLFSARALLWFPTRGSCFVVVKDMCDLDGFIYDEAEN
jgi:hypothetical protein